MYFKQFLHDDLGCSSYLIASRDSRRRHTSVFRR